jgi:exopolyphosphatase/guanosine-5'-triphosphate,3'-diphosphate pyrophosphatase
MRVAVVDIGTNSTRLLVAEVRDGAVVRDLHRESIVTRLGEGVDASGRLGDAAMQRVFDVLERYRALIDEHGATHTTAVLTSAVRDAANGAQLTAAVRERYALDARTIGGDEEANLTFAGATSEREHDGAETVVVDIGGGSTELIVGRDGEVDFHVSTQAGVVRQSERHLHDDPPKPEQLQALAAEVRGILDDAVPADVRARTATAIAVAGTATQCAAIELALETYDPARVHGHVLELATCELLLARLAQMTDAQRREVVGLHPARAPTIVAGIAMLIEVLRAFGLQRAEVSEHDILRGAALAVAARAGTENPPKSAADSG